MRTRIILISLLSLGFAGAVLIACTSEHASGNGDPRRVAASFYPLAFAAEQIAPGIEVENLTPPGAEPHDIELDAGAVEELQSAGLVLLMGRDFQPQLEQAAERASGEV